MRGRAYWQAQAEAKDLIIHELRVMLKEQRERIGELEDAERASTLAELRAVRPIAMPLPDNDDDYDPRNYGTDPTGLYVEKLPPLTAWEQEIANQIALGNG